MKRHPVPPSATQARAHPRSSEPDEEERAVLITLFAQGQHTEVLTMARDLTRRYPRHGLAWKALGASLKRLGHTQEALAPSQKATQLMPRDHEAFNNLGVVLKDLGRVDQAIGCFKHALDLKSDHADAWGNLAGAMRDKGELVEALRCYRRKALLMPHDAEAKYHVAALSGERMPCAPQAYVQGVFDHYAATFESHLQQTLQYDMPAKLYGALQERLRSRPGWRVLDLGCGTGLMAPPLAPHASSMVGVDLSGRMLAVAAGKQVYQRLVQADIVTMMQGEPDGSHDLIVAADVFVYMGELEAVFEQVRRLLAPGGLFAFSAEGLDAPDALPMAQDHDEGFKLRPSGRYAHAQAYLLALARQHALSVEVMAATTQRLDQGQPVPGYMVVLAGDEVPVAAQALASLAT